jgi:predicted transcriptional regulator
MARKITIYMPGDLEDRIGDIATRQGRSVSSIIVEAVQARYGRKDGDQIDPALRQVARMEARLDKAIRDNIMVKEALLLFVRVWLEHNPPLDEHLEESAAASAAARFERFLDFIAQAISSGRSLAIFEPASTSSSNGALEEVAS